MSIVPNAQDEAYARGLEHGYAAASEMRWRKYPGSAPADAPGSDGRALVWIKTGDGMAYVGLRHYRAHSDGDGHGWYSGSAEESGNVTHWMPLPQPPWLVGCAQKASVEPADQNACREMLDSGHSCLKERGHAGPHDFK